MNILVTGGASGLGKAITEKLASSGSNEVYFTFCHSAESAKEIENRFTNAHAIACDFTNNEQVKTFAQQLESISPDMLIHNAISGTIHRNYFHKTDPAVFAAGFTNNILPVIQLTQSALGIFRKKKSGTIITILSSDIIDKAPIGVSEYLAVKNYLLSLSKSWAAENAKFGICSYAVSPSFMQTPLNADLDERVVEEMANNHPLKRLLKPQEVADAISKLISKGMEINGMNFPINAGEHVI